MQPGVVSMERFRDQPTEWSYEGLFVIGLVLLFVATFVGFGVFLKVQRWFARRAIRQRHDRAKREAIAQRHERVQASSEDSTSESRRRA